MKSGHAFAHGRAGRPFAQRLEDTFYLPDGSKVTSNAPLIEQLARYARDVGRDVATPQEARRILHLAA